jgi:uncharacterized protein (DUF1810 family)
MATKWWVTPVLSFPIMPIGAADSPNLQRFVDAQQHAISSIIEELKHGRKRGHWIWFIFPQLKGLGHSANSEFYGISSLQEAAAYLQHALLGPRLKECTQLVNAVEGHSAQDIFGEIDALKFRSSMTLFAKAASDNQIFINAIEKYFAGEFDALTIERLEGEQPAKAKLE